MGGKGRDDPEVRAGGRGLRGESRRGRGEVGGRFAKGSSPGLGRDVGPAAVFVAGSEGGGICCAELEDKAVGGIGKGEDWAVEG